MGRSKRKAPKNFSGIPLDRLERMRSEFHAVSFDDAEDPATLNEAIDLFENYPSFIEYIGLLDERKEDATGKRHGAFQDFKALHMRVTDFLVTAAERRGVDGSALIEFGRLCRLHSSDHPRTGPAETDRWPDCLGPKREQLDAVARASIIAGSATLARLRASTHSTGSSSRDRQGFSTARIRQMTSLQANAINRYARMANLKTARPGERNFIRSFEDARRLLHTIIANSSESRVIECCQKSILDHF